MLLSEQEAYFPDRKDGKIERKEGKYYRKKELEEMK